MINKISSIKNLAVFKDFEWDKSVLNADSRPIPFEKINILYGRNYSGKTTLSRILRAMEIGWISDKYESPTFSVLFADGTSVNQREISACDKNIRVFNEDFVRENLRFISNPDDTIEPFAILGDDNNILEKEIANLEDEVGSKAEGNETGLHAKLKADTKVKMDLDASYEQMTNSLDKQLAEKATGRSSGIKYKLDKFGEPNYNKIKLKSDIRKVLSDTYIPLGDDKKSEYEQLLTERTKPTIPVLPALSLQWEQFCSESEELLSKEIGASDKIVELLRDVTLNEWVKKGCELHKDNRTTCAFCGGTLTDDRWTVLYRHFDEESGILEDKIDSLLKRIETEIKSVKDSFQVDPSLFYSKFQNQIMRLSQSYSESLSNYLEQLGLIGEQLTQRKREITVSLSFEHPVDYSQELETIMTSYEKVRSQSNGFSSKLNKEQTEAKKALLLQEVYDFCTTIGYSAIVDNIDELEGKLDAADEVVERTQAEIKAKEIEIQDKKRQLNDEEKGSIRINEYLTNFFGHDFLSLQAVETLDDDQERKIRFEIVRDGKRAYHLSEGESRLIAFCYFMAKLDDVETKDTKPIIWIDDPISSLDGNHIFFVYSLIAAEIAEKGLFEQLFVSTHNLDFLKYLRRLKSFELQENGKPKSCEKQYFIITRQDSYSTVLKMPKYLKDYGTEFNYLFACIYKCSQITTVDDTNFEQFYNFGNNARKFLEIYLYFKYPDFSEDKLQRFFGENKVPSILTDRINNEYSHLKGSIERAAMPVEVPEMVSTAKLIIDKVKEDNDQYSALMNSIGKPFESKHPILIQP